MVFGGTVRDDVDRYEEVSEAGEDGRVTLPPPHPATAQATRLNLPRKSGHLNRAPIGAIGRADVQENKTKV